MCVYYALMCNFYFLCTFSCCIWFGDVYTLTICYTRILKMHFRARETSYRVVTTNYMSSLRAFHDLSERMSSMDRFLKFLLNNLKQVSGSLRPDARDLFELWQHILGLEFNVGQSIWEHRSQIRLRLYNYRNITRCTHWGRLWHTIVFGSVMKCVRPDRISMITRFNL